MPFRVILARNTHMKNYLYHNFGKGRIAFIKCWEYIYAWYQKVMSERISIFIYVRSDVC